MYLKRKKFKVGFLHPSESRKRFVNEGRFMAAQVRELGGEAIVKGANDDEKLQLEQRVSAARRRCHNPCDLSHKYQHDSSLGASSAKAGVDVIIYIRIVNIATFTAF